MNLCPPFLAGVLFASVAFAQSPPENAPPAVPLAQAPATQQAPDPEQASAPPIELRSDASGMISQEQFRELLRYAQDKEVENEKLLRNYTYVEREEERNLDGKGRVKKVETRSHEVLEVYGEPVERLIAKDDKPLTPEEIKKEDDRLEKIADKRKNESESDRRKRLEKEEKEREENRKFVLEIADAFNFRLAGSEAIEGRDTWVIEAKPRPGYEPKERDAKLLNKIKGNVWIDKADGQWVKLEVTVIDTISFGWFLARVHGGAHVLAEQTKVNDEVWLPKHIAVQADVRLALFKNENEDIDATYHDYKKFRAESKMTVVGETPE